jgi:8-amino-7-oxononanoate synthase
MNDSRAVAIIGMSCSFPGSPDVDAFWKTIRDGRTCFSEVPADRWDHSLFYSPNPRAQEMTYARKIGRMQDVRTFAPEHFGMPPRRAYPMDPQQRLMLTAAWLALENAGYSGRSLPASTGVFVGASHSEYKDLVVSRLRARQLLQGEWGDVPQLPEKAPSDAVSQVYRIHQYSMVGVLQNMIACNVSEAFDFRGPSLVTDAACSSALLALHEAVLHLRDGICDAAVVGGVYSICTPDMMVGFSRIGALSKSDVCRPFDRRADGFVLGEGAGAIVVKRLEDALKDGDRICSIIRGVGMNNDGRGAGPMTPRQSGQVDALARAYRDAGMSLSQIGAVEAHGTATPVGDRTEISSLLEFARQSGSAPKRCAVSSVKGNIGHTLAASGMAGLIKAVLTLNHELIPAQAGWQEAQPDFGLEESGFFIPATPQTFARDGKDARRVGVNSFGFGGTNVHVILEEAPRTVKRTQAAVRLRPEQRLFLVSAAKGDLLVKHLSALAEAIQKQECDLDDAAYTLTCTRRLETARVAFLAANRAEAAAKLSQAKEAVLGFPQEGIAYAPEPAPEVHRRVGLFFNDGARSLESVTAALPGFEYRLKALCAEASDVAAEAHAFSDERNGNQTGRKLELDLLRASAEHLAMAEYLGELGLVPDAVSGEGTGDWLAQAFRGSISARKAFAGVARMARKREHSGKNGAMPANGNHGRGHNMPARLLSGDDNAEGVNIVVSIGGRGEVELIVKSVSEESDGERIASSQDTDSVLGVLAALMTQGVPMNLSRLFEGAHLVDLPSAPLAAREFWVVGDKPGRTESPRPANIEIASAPAADQVREAGLDGHASSSATADLRSLSNPQLAEQVSAPAIATEDLNPSAEFARSGAPLQNAIDEIRPIIFEHIARVSSFPLENLRVEQRLGRDLGFDSLMSLDLYTSLKESIATELDLPEEIIGEETTVEELIRAIAALRLRSKTDRSSPAAAGSAFRRYTVVSADRELAPLTRYFEFPLSALTTIVSDRADVAQALADKLRNTGREVEIAGSDDEIVFKAHSAVIDLCGLNEASGMNAGSLRDPVIMHLRRAARAASQEPSAWIVVHRGIAMCGLAGAAKALASEWSGCFVRGIEIGETADSAQLAQIVFDEIAGTSVTAEVSYASGRRQIRELCDSPLEAGGLRPRAVVAISGGARGIGAKLAVHLAEQHQARLLLLGRSADPGAIIDAIHAAGGDALYVSCDIRNADATEKAFCQCAELFGPVEHVVHAAGVNMNDSVAKLDWEEAHAVFDTKVAGALALWNTAPHFALKSFIMLGSWAGRFGNSHQTAYSAANHVLTRLASHFSFERPDVHTATVDLPPWSGSTMVNALPESARKQLMSRIHFLDDSNGLDHLAAEMSANTASGEVLIGRLATEEPIQDHAILRVSIAEFPWLHDHRIDGRAVLPFAYFVDLAASAARRLGLQPSMLLLDAEMLGMPVVPDDEVCLLDVSARRTGGTVEVRIEMTAEGARRPVMQVRCENGSITSALSAPEADEAHTRLTLEQFYRDHTFHGPLMQSLACIEETGARHASALLKSSSIGGDCLNILALDGMLQLCAYWSSATLGCSGLPVGADEIRIHGGSRSHGVRATGLLKGSSGNLLSCHLDLVNAAGEATMQIRGLRCRLTDMAADPHAAEPANAHERGSVDPSWFRIEEFPEVQALHQRFEIARISGLADPYFPMHQGISSDTSRIDGEEYINFASYNYLGLSGDSDVNAAVFDAVRQYGSSVSASRLASGERPLHRELEWEIADFLGCEDAIVMVGGHATNVSVIGTLLGPLDMVIHDSLAHDSILAGIRLSGAKRRSFRHNDADALEEILRQSRASARRVLIAIEGVYSMDGDIAPLRRIVEIKRRYHALLLVDEAHSLGVLGTTGRGAGEHAGVAREDVELWMGTLSKSLASCGGYIAGSSALVRYLKYSNPGFVYSVGISPANAAAALAALRKLRANPGLVETLRKRSEFFLDLCRAAGVDTGFSGQTAVVPCIVGNSIHSVQLAHAMRRRRVNIQPILYPAVDENQARLRFFVTARHTEQQLKSAVEVLTEEVTAIAPSCLRSLVNPRSDAVAVG